MCWNLTPWANSQYCNKEKARQGGGIEPLHVSMPHELKSRPSTSPTHPGCLSLQLNPFVARFGPLFCNVVLPSLRSLPISPSPGQLLLPVCLSVCLSVSLAPFLHSLGSICQLSWQPYIHIPFTGQCDHSPASSIIHRLWRKPWILHAIVR